ncbi:MAG: tRNA (N(6)-L-threonylcarbamoyladenosine(37)-C(2))-methylthiotransferase MtaB [Campylobacterales bacterium]
MKKVYFKTFGCRTNMFDTQTMIEHIGAYELTNDESLADVVVINSCTVTNGADTGVRQYISKVKSKNNDTKILFTGCGVQTEGKKLFEAGKVDLVFGHSEKTRLTSFFEEPQKLFVEGDKNYIDDSVVTNFEGKTKAFIKIQEGCDFACSYCIIPSVRGHSRAIPARTVIRQIEVLADSGFSEFILTGTNVGSYRDNDTTLEKLMKAIIDLGLARRVRLGSVEPSQITDEFLDIVSHETFSKQLHIAIQHSSNAMLERMNRKNRFEDDLRLFERLSRLGFAIGTDYIVGFPGESDAIWDEAVQNLKAMPLTHIHPFVYSKRDGTPAAQIKADVNGNVSKERLHQINEIVAEKNYEFRKKLTVPLIVNVEDSKMSGFDQFFNKITFRAPQEREWVEVREREITMEKTIG